MLNFITYAWKPFLLVIVVLAAAYGLRFLSYHLIRRANRTYASYGASALQFAAVVGGLYAVAKIYDVDPTLIIATIAIVTAGISLHAGQIIEASIAGAVILADGKIAVGEQVTVADTSGVVVDIGFSSVTIQSNTRGLVSIPSSKIVGDIIVNHTRLQLLEQSLSFIFYDTNDNSQVISVVNDVLSGQGLADGSKILHDWVDGSQVYAVVFKTQDYAKRREIASKLSLALTEAFEDERFPVGSVTFTKAI